MHVGGKDNMWDILSPTGMHSVIQTQPESKTKEEELILPQIVPEREDIKERQLSGYKTTRVKRRELEPSVESKVRELEILVIDTREELTRTIKRLMEEMSGKLKRELGTIELRDEGTRKVVETKTGKLADSLEASRQTYSSLVTSVSNKLNLLQRKVDEVEIRLVSVEKGVERAVAVKTVREVVTKEDEHLKDEVKQLREQAREDRKKHETQFKELITMFTDLDSRSKSQLNGMNQYLQRLNITSGTPQKEVVVDPNRIDVERIDSKLRSIERVLETEVTKRIKMEDTLVKYLDDRVSSVKARINQEEKELMKREKKMLGNMQEGLITVNDIIKGSNEENSLKLSKVETGLAHVIKALEQMMGETTKILEKNIVIQGEDVKTLSQRLSELEATTANNFRNLSDLLAEEISKCDSKLEDSYKLLLAEQEKLLNEIRTNEKEVKANKSEFMELFDHLKKKLNKEINENKEQIIMQQKFIEETKLLLRYDWEETKKSLNTRCIQHEKLTEGNISNINTTLTKRIDNFTIRIGNDLNDHKTNITENVGRQNERIEKNRNLVDEHIRQQANAIKALCRALTEKEAAERREAIENLGLRTADKFTTLEKEMNKRLLDVEIDTKRFTEQQIQKVQDEMEKIQKVQDEMKIGFSDLEVTLTMEKIINTIDSQSQDQEIKEFWKTLTNHMDDYKKEMKELYATLHNNNEDLQGKVNVNSRDINEVKVDTGVRIAMADIISKVEMEDNLKRLATTVDSVDRLEVLIGNLQASTTTLIDKVATYEESNAKDNNEELKKELDRLSKDIEEEIICSQSHRVIVDATLEAIENRLESFNDN